jgi:serine/threonine protein kinase
VDLWSVGCILCEMCRGKALFPGMNHIDMLRLIGDIRGSPEPEDVLWVPSGSEGQDFLQRFCPPGRTSQLAKTIPTASSQCVDLVHQLLEWDPSTRPSAVDAQEHIYLRRYLPTSPPPEPELLDWSFDSFRPTPARVQERLYAECARVHPEILDRDYDELCARGFFERVPQAASACSRLHELPQEGEYFKRNSTPRPFKPRGRCEGVYSAGVGSNVESKSLPGSRHNTPPRPRTFTPPNVESKSLPGSRENTPSRQRTNFSREHTITPPPAPRGRIASGSTWASSTSMSSVKSGSGIHPLKTSRSTPVLDTQDRPKPWRSGPSHYDDSDFMDPPQLIRTASDATQSRSPKRTWPVGALTPPAKGTVRRIMRSLERAAARLRTPTPRGFSTLDSPNADSESTKADTASQRGTPRRTPRSGAPESLLGTRTADSLSPRRPSLTSIANVLRSPRTPRDQGIVGTAVSFRAASTAA